MITIEPMPFWWQFSQKIWIRYLIAREDCLRNLQYEAWAKGLLLIF